MKRKLRLLLMFAFCLLLGFSLIILSKMTNGQHLYVSPKVVDDYKITIEGEQQDMENLKVLVEDAQNKLNEYEALAEANEDLVRELEEQMFDDIAFYQLASGSVDARGPGVVVTIDDGDRDLEPWEDPNDILVHDLDLLLIINELKASGAEMISVNGQRLVDETSISCSGYTVRINGQFFARPFIIKAIGDGSRMSAALIGPGGYGTWLKEWGLLFKVKITDDIIIPKYTEERNYKYMGSVVKVKEGGNN